MQLSANSSATVALKFSYASLATGSSVQYFFFTLFDLAQLLTLGDEDRAGRAGTRRRDQEELEGPGADRLILPVAVDANAI